MVVTRVKALTNVTSTIFFAPSSNHRFHLHLLLLSFPNVFSSFSSFQFREIMKNFRPAQVPMIPPNLLNQSTEFNLPPNHVQDPLVKRCLSTEEWTDEKHSMYLKSMEASFVKQLYYSKQVLGWCSSNAAFSHSARTTSSQSKDDGGGCWRKIKFGRENGQISRRNEWHDLEANPWNQQLRCTIVEGSLASTTPSKVSGLGEGKQIPSASPHNLHSCHHDKFFSDIEMSDQNFADEEVECEKKNVKRLKSLISDTSLHHQG